jgi:hypothetical protein
MANVKRSWDRLQVVKRLTALVVVGLVVSGCTVARHAPPTQTRTSTPTPTPTPTKSTPPSARISGRLLTVVPVDGRLAPLTMGTVVISGAMAAHAVVDSTGHFRVAVRPGLYRVDGRIHVAHPDFYCRPVRGVSVRSGSTATVNVHCLSDAG